MKKIDSICAKDIQILKKEKVSQIDFVDFKIKAKMVINKTKPPIENQYRKPTFAMG